MILFMKEIKNITKGRDSYMLNTIFEGIFDNEYIAIISPSTFLLCVGCALLIGFFLAGCYSYKSRSTKSFVSTLALLPSIVCVVIMMVNGNVGTGVAVAGSFSLVRFRSAAGSAKEIGAIFLAMATGLMVGMGYLGYAILCAFILGTMNFVYNQMNFGSKNTNIMKTLRITIPEDLDYSDVFEPILQNYASDYELIQVKTTNMGSLFRLTYDLTLLDASLEKEMIDQLRCRNGNLEITVSKQETLIGEL